MSSEPRARSIQFYTGEDAVPLGDEVMAPPHIDESVWPVLRDNSTVPGQNVKLLFKGEGPDGFSLVWSWFGANFRLPRHSHDADCLYYVVSGEIRMGARVLQAGEGFLVKAGAPYTYQAGPDGVTVLEFRTATSFDMNIRDQTPERWMPIVEAVQANRERWVADWARMTADGAVTPTV